MSRNVLISAAFVAFGLSDSAMAADVSVLKPVKAERDRPSYYDWTGPYVGFHFGYGTGRFGDGSSPLPLQGVFFPPSITGLIGGYQAGYNHQFANGLVLGLEADVTFMSPVDVPRLEPAPFNTTFNYFATVRGRVGKAFGNVLPLRDRRRGLGQTKLELNDVNGDPLFADRSANHLGWTAGIGIEHVLTGKWNREVRVQLHRPRVADLSPGPAGEAGRRRRSQGACRQARAELSLVGYPIGIDRLAGDQGAEEGRSAGLRRLEHPRPDDRPVAGLSRLPLALRRGEQPARQGPDARDLDLDRLHRTAAVGGRRGLFQSRARPRVRGQIARWGWPDFPMARPRRAARPTPGSARSVTSSARPSGSAASRKPSRTPPISSAASATSTASPSPLAASRSAISSTLIPMRTIRAPISPIGRCGPRRLMTSRPICPASPAARWSSSTARTGALRAGLFQVPAEPNSDVLTFNTGGVVVEWEGRYAIHDQPGKLRLGVFANRGNTGNNREALAIVAADPTIDINDAMVSIRRPRPKQGFYANVEQAVSKEVGVFGRYSWNDGKNEILSFTDIDRSLSGGVSIMGASWGRPADKVGIGGAINGLSAEKRDFLAAGGLGLLIRRAQLPPGDDLRDVLRVERQQMDDCHLRLSVHRQSRLQR